MTMCTVKEIQEAIREDCKSQHDMESTDIDRVMQTLPFAQEEPFTEARSRKPLFWLCHSKNKPPAMQGEDRSLDISKNSCAKIKVGLQNHK